MTAPCSFCGQTAHISSIRIEDPDSLSPPLLNDYACDDCTQDFLALSVLIPRFAAKPPHLLVGYAQTQNMSNIPKEPA